MKSRLSSSILFILVLTLALQAFALPAQALSEANENQAETGERSDAILPNPEVIAKTQAQVNSFTCTDDMDIPKIECEALVALYDSTNGADWTNNTNWLQSTTVSNWYGVSVSVGSGVNGLNMDSNQLNGNIPAELGNLSNLLGLSLRENQLTGGIPSSLGDLSYVRFLYLDNNQLTGSIPESLGNLSNMHSLYLYENQLSGNIPPTFGNLSDLQVLDLSNNRLTGSIPAVLGDLPDLYDVALQHNQLTGGIPTELGNLSDMEYLNLSENQFTGSIPLSFVNLSMLTYFQFDGTNLCEPSTPEFLAWKNTVDEWYGTGVICGENLPPVALDDSYTTPLNTTLNVPVPGVLSNDTDADNDALTAIKLSDPASGTLTFNENGSFTYAPVPGFGGTVSFSYKANDGELDSNIATVTILVKPFEAIYLPLIIK